jgi:hypothetical protein
MFPPRREKMTSPVLETRRRNQGTLNFLRFHPPGTAFQNGYRTLRTGIRKSAYENTSLF